MDHYSYKFLADSSFLKFRLNRDIIFHHLNYVIFSLALQILCILILPSLETCILFKCSYLRLLVHLLILRLFLKLFYNQLYHIDANKELVMMHIKLYANLTKM